MKIKKIFIVLLWAILFSWAGSFLWINVFLNISAKPIADYLFFKNIYIAIIMTIFLITIVIGWNDLLPGTKDTVIVERTNIHKRFGFLIKRGIAFFLLFFTVSFILLNGVFILYSSVVIGGSYFSPDYSKQLALFFEKNGVQCEKNNPTAVRKLIIDTKNAAIIANFNNKYFQKFNWFTPAIIITIIVLIPLGIASGYYSSNWCLSGVYVVPIYIFIEYIPSIVPSISHNVFNLFQKNIIIATGLFCIYLFSYCGCRLRPKVVGNGVVLPLLTTEEKTKTNKNEIK